MLKLGSKGEKVKVLQEFLGIAADGDFGPKTETAVKAWQAANGLKADGIVGQATETKMGLLDTDNTSSANPSFESITYDKLYMDSDEYFKGPTKKRWVFLHHTAGWHDPYGTISGWNNDTRGTIGTEFVLGGQSVKGDNSKFDGVLVQAFPRGGYAWHTGTGRHAMHTDSVGIEVCNFGQLTKGGYHKNGVWVKLKAESYYTYVGVEADPRQIVELAEAFRGYKTWHRYSDKQVDMMHKWILYIANRDSIDIRKGLVELIHSRGVFEAFDYCDVAYASSRPGMYCHTNVMRGKVDLFPQQEVVDMLMSL